MEERARTGNTFGGREKEEKLISIGAHQEKEYLEGSWEEGCEKDKPRDHVWMEQKKKIPQGPRKYPPLLGKISKTYY